MGQNNYQKRVGGGAGTGAAQGALAGGMAGSAFGPWGTAIGAGVGGVGGGIYGGVTGDQAYHRDQRMAKRADRAGATQGMQARQGAISMGLGGGGVQTQTDTQAYNQVMAQYAALRNALEMQRMNQQAMMYSQVGQLVGMYGMAGRGGAGSQAGTGPSNYYGSNSPGYGTGGGF